MDIIESERVHLKFELLEDPHCPENCFIEQALGELLTRKQLLVNVRRIFQIRIYVIFFL